VGTVTVQNGSTFTTDRGNITIGQNGSGTMNVLGGSSFTATQGTGPSADAFVGYAAGATGTLNVDGAGSNWSLPNGILHVGSSGAGGPTAGTGVVNVTNGATLAPSSTLLGLNGGSGTLNVDASTLNTGNLGVGVGGTGVFNIINGGIANIGAQVLVGDCDCSFGTVTVSGAGSQFISTSGSSGDITIGVGGTGVFNVLNSATATFATDVELGTNGGSGTVNVQNGGTFSTPGALIVGEFGAGAVNITGGGIVNVDGTVILGNCDCSVGTVTVSGAGSQFNSTTLNPNGVAIGLDGIGTLNVTNGGAASFLTDVYVGAGFGSGTLTVQNGTFTTTQGLILGFGNDATVTVSGANSVFNVTTQTVIGAGGGGTSTLNVLDGASPNLASIQVGAFSPGTLKVDATSQANGTGYVQGGVGTFNVGISPTGNGKVAITGGDIDLTAAGALVVNAKTTQAKKYDIMTTDVGAVLGTFSSVSVVGNANNLQVAYNVPCGAGSCVELSVDTFSLANVLPPGTGGNAAHVAGALDKAIAGGLTIPDAFFDVFALSGSNLVNALSQLSGEPAAGATQSNTQLMNSFLSLLLNPFGGAPNGNPGAFSYAREFGAGEKVSPAAAAAYAAVTPKDKRPDSFAARWGVWGQAYGGYNKTDGNTTAGSHDSTARTYGLATGFDYRVSGDTMVGFALAGAGENWGLSDGLGGGHGDALQLGAYGSKQYGAAYVSGALAYTVHNITTDRTITVAGSDHLTANFAAQSVGGRLETGYRLQTVYAGVTPYAAAQVQDFFTPSYGENAVSGSNVFALSYGARSTVATRTELGAWFDKMMALEQGNALSLRLRAAWANDHQTNQGIGATFQTLPGASFTVNGAAPATNLALVTAGVEYRLANNVSFGAKFDGELASNSQTYSGTGTVRYVW
jgi:T5SS/PEP-CTERM-associated repeat protein